MKLSSATLARIYDLAIESAGGIYAPHGDLSGVKCILAQAFVDAIDVVILEELGDEEFTDDDDGA